jgi:protein TonB
MNTNMILPAAIAAGIHAGVFAIRFDPAPPPPPVPVDPIEIWSVPPIPPDETEQPIDRRETEDPLPPPVDVVSRGAERFTTTPLNPDDFTIVVTPSPPVIGDRLSIIPANVGPGDGSGLGDRPIDVGLLDNNPRVVFRMAPTPPREARDVVAEVTVEFIVDREGRVIDAQIVHSSHSHFEEPCLRAVRRWRFEPGLKKNLPVAFRVQQTFVFNPHD